MLHDFRRPARLRRPLPFAAGVLLLAGVVVLWLHPSAGRAGRCRSRPVMPCCPCPEVPAGPSAEEAIRQVLDAQVTAWNRGDLEAFMAGYWASPELSFFSAGNHTQGWEATLERYRKRYQSEGQEMGRLKIGRAS